MMRVTSSDEIAMSGSPAVEGGCVACSSFVGRAVRSCPISVIEIVKMLNINDVINDVLKVCRLLGSSGSGHHVAMCRVADASSWCQSSLCLVPPVSCL